MKPPNLVSVLKTDGSELNFLPLFRKGAVCCFRIERYILSLILGGFYFLREPEYVFIVVVSVNSGILEIPFERNIFVALCFFKYIIQIHMKFN